MSTSKKNFLSKYSLAATALMTVYGCCFDSTEKFEPPPKQQIEKKYVTKENKKDAATADEPELPAKTPKYLNINKVILNDVNGTGFLGNINFVSRWNILGPFPYKAEKTVDSKVKSVLHAPHIEDEKKLTGSEKTAASLKWQLARFEDPARPGEINLRKFFKPKEEHLFAYAVTYLQCAKELSGLTLYTGSNGYIKVWINHQLVHAYDHARREGKWDQDAVKNIKLRKGYNLVVVKCVAVESPWSFYLRLADADNQPLKFVPSEKVPDKRSK